MTVAVERSGDRMRGFVRKPIVVPVVLGLIALGMALVGVSALALLATMLVLVAACAFVCMMWAHKHRPDKSHWTR